MNTKKVGQVNGTLQFGLVKILQETLKKRSAFGPSLWVTKDKTITKKAKTKNVFGQSQLEVKDNILKQINQKETLQTHHDWLDLPV